MTHTDILTAIEAEIAALRGATTIAGPEHGQRWLAVLEAAAADYRQPDSAQSEMDGLRSANETLRSRIRAAEAERDGYLRGMLTAAELGGKLAQEIRKRMGDEA